MADKRLTFVQMVVIGLAVAGLLIPLLEPIARNASRRQYERDHAAFFLPVQTAEEHFREERYLEALASVDAAVAAARGMSDLRESDLADAYELKAATHVALWQYIDAERALDKVLDLGDPSRSEGVRQRLAQLRDIIKRTEVERQEQTVYYAGRDHGPAKRLIGKVAIVYVFVDGGRHSNWTRRQRLFAVRVLKEVEHWYAQKAKEWGRSEPTFSERIFNYGRDPWLDNALHRLGARRPPGTGFELARRVARLRGQDEVNRFLETIAAEEGAQQAMLLIHVKHEARSYAVPCYRPSLCSAEYAYLLAAPVRNSWGRIKFLAAHEGLHLFGADDLYNIRGGRDYAPRDVMHRPSRFLVASTVDSLTAYAIGWSERVPAAPFKIITTE